jgi:DNA-binding MarR family transcriptional regulator
MQDGSPKIPEAGAAQRGETGHIGYLLRQAHGASRLRIERELADLEITPPQFSVLTLLNAYPGLSGADLARLSVLTPQTVSVIVANLERRGAIVRRPHPVHGRVLQIEVSEAGRGLLSICRERVARIEAEWLAGLTGDEERIIRRWLVRLALPAD